MRLFFFTRKNIYVLFVIGTCQNCTHIPRTTEPNTMNRTTSQVSDAHTYLEKHKINQVMQQLMTLLLHQRPGGDSCGIAQPNDL
jgi:glycosylphosphatidylinositol transamidase (GPIT) subunit GPI8